MNRAYYKSAGCYLPAFFFLDVKTYAPLEDLDSLPEEDKSTLCHEYVHFLQDITTVFGLINITHTVQIQKMINRTIIASPGPQIEVPVVPGNDAANGINIDLFRLYQGDYERDDMAPIDHIEEIWFEPNEFIPGFEELPSVIVQYVDIDGKSAVFEFGAVCVMESMAHLIQDALYEDVTPTYFPYEIAKEVCRFLYPELAEDNLNVIVLCDIAYNSVHPGKFFHDFIIEMKVQGILPKKHTDFYDLLEDFKFTDKAGRDFNFYGMYQKQAAIAEEQLKDFFTLPLYDDIKTWFERILRFGTDIRMHDIAFWLKILDHPTKQERRDAFTALTRSFGFPLMTNLNHHYYFDHPDIVPQKIVVLKAVHEVNQVLFSGQHGCGMKDFCRQPDDITSALCDEPWKRALEEHLCPFAQIWKMWGLAGKEVIYLDGLTKDDK